MVWFLREFRVEIHTCLNQERHPSTLTELIQIELAHEKPREFKVDRFLLHQQALRFKPTSKKTHINLTFISNRFL